MSPQTPDLWNWNKERENTKPTPPPPLHHPPSPHPSQGQCEIKREKKKKNFDSPLNAQDQWQIRGGRGVWARLNLWTNDDFCQWQRQRHQLDNDDGKKEARFIGLGIWEREREENVNLRLKREIDPVKPIHFPFKFLTGWVGFYGPVRKNWWCCVCFH